MKSLLDRHVYRSNGDRVRHKEDQLCVLSRVLCPNILLNASKFVWWWDFLNRLGILIYRRINCKIRPTELGWGRSTVWCGLLDVKLTRLSSSWCQLRRLKSFGFISLFLRVSYQLTVPFDELCSKVYCTTNDPSRVTLFDAPNFQLVRTDKQMKMQGPSNNTQGTYAKFFPDQRR